MPAVETVDLAIARARLAKLIERAAEGELIVITRDDNPRAMLGPVTSPSTRPTQPAKHARYDTPKVAALLKEAFGKRGRG